MPTTYDDASNRTSEQVNGGTLVTSTFTTGNQLIQRGSQTATYDANGNRISAQNGQSSPHNAKDQASSLSDSTSTLAATYAGPGVTTRTQLGTVVYYHDQLGVAAENIIPGTGTRYTRTPAGRVIGQRNAATNYYLLTDRQDSVTRHGGYHDTTGHVKMGARYYTPYTGSFLEVEPLKNPSEVRGLIDYTYAAGDPVNFYDPSGLIVQQQCIDILQRRHPTWPAAALIKACDYTPSSRNAERGEDRIRKLCAVGGVVSLVKLCFLWPFEVHCAVFGVLETFGPKPPKPTS